MLTGNNLQPPQYQHFHHHYQNTTYSTVHIKPLIGNVAFLTQKRRYCNAVSFCALFMLITAFLFVLLQTSFHILKADEHDHWCGLCLLKFSVFPILSFRFSTSFLNLTKKRPEEELCRPFLYQLIVSPTAER